MLRSPLWARFLVVAAAVGVGGLALRDRLPQASGVFSASAPDTLYHCVTAVNPQTLSETAVKALAAIEWNTPRTVVETKVGQPYCQLPVLSVRANFKAFRYLYQCAGNPSWVVVLYEDDRFLDFALSSRSPVK